MKIASTKLISSKMQSEITSDLKKKLGLGDGITYNAQSGKSEWLILTESGIENGHLLVTTRRITVYIHKIGGSASFGYNKAEESYEGELWHEQELIENFKEANEDELLEKMKEYYKLIEEEKLSVESNEKIEEIKERETEEEEEITIPYIDLKEAGFEDWVKEKYEIEKDTLVKSNVANFIWLWEEYKTYLNDETIQVSKPRRIG